MLDSPGGFLLPEHRWEMSNDLLKYGPSPSEIQTPVALPTPTQLKETPAPEEVFSKSTISKGKWVGIGLAGFAAWKALRFIIK
jgi:hypothetical protein